MTIKVHNNTKFKKLYILCEGNEYKLSGVQYVEIETQNSTAKVLIDVRDENKVYLDIIDMFFGIFIPEHSICKINCSYAFDLVSNYDHCDITINDLNSVCDNNIVFRSASVEVEDSAKRNIDYILSNIESVKKKHTLLQVFVLSAFPLILIAAIMCIVDFSLSTFALLLFCLLAFLSPAIKRIKQFNNFCTEENARTELLRAELDKNSGIKRLNKKETKWDKFMSNLFERIFK